MGRGRPKKKLSKLERRKLAIWEREELGSQFCVFRDQIINMIDVLEEHEAIVTKLPPELDRHDMKDAFEAVKRAREAKVRVAAIGVVMDRQRSILRFVLGAVETLSGAVQVNSDMLLGRVKTPQHREQLQELIQQTELLKLEAQQLVDRFGAEARETSEQQQLRLANFAQLVHGNDLEAGRHNIDPAYLEDERISEEEAEDLKSQHLEEFGSSGGSSRNDLKGWRRRQQAAEREIEQELIDEGLLPDHHREEDQ